MYDVKSSLFISFVFENPIYNVPRDELDQLL